MGILTVDEVLCSRCKKIKSAKEFTKNKNSKNGLSSWCKLCHNISRRKPESEYKPRRSRKGERNKRTAGLSIDDRIEQRILKNEDHWIWQGGLNNKQPFYSYKEDGSMRHTNIRRYTYEKYKKIKLLKQKVVKQSCSIQKCVKPEHTYIPNSITLSIEKKTEPSKNTSYWVNDDRLIEFCNFLERHEGALNQALIIQPSLLRILPYFNGEKINKIIALELGVSRQRVSQLFSKELRGIPRTIRRLKAWYNSNYSRQIAN